MVPSLKSEFRKLLTVRSTYLVTLVIIALSCLFTYLGTGPELVDKGPNERKPSSSQQQNGGPPQLVKTKNLQSNKLANNILDATGAATFIAVVVILLMAHEFRYNTITYTLASSNSRSRVLVSKIIVGVTFVVVAALLAELVTIAITYLAVHVKGLNLPPQDINWAYINARLLGYILGFALIGLAIITLVRNLTAAIVGLFLLPTLDSLLGLILTKNNIEPSRYLPFSALGRIGNSYTSSLTPNSLPSIDRAVLVFAVYLVGLWAITWYLFLRRDATA